MKKELDELKGVLTMLNRRNDTSYIVDALTSKYSRVQIFDSGIK